MKIFLDANVIVSVLNNEIPLFTYSSRILSLPSYNSRFKIFTSPLCLAIAFYFSEKKCGTKRSLEKINILLNHINIVNTGEKEVLLSSSNKKILDFEDGMQYYSAVNGGCNCIITEDLEDFHFAEIPVYSSRDFILNILKL